MVTATIKNLANLRVSNICKLYLHNKKSVITLVILALSTWTYINPQGFLNLWLTRDQQGMMLLEQGETSKAALTFNDKQWVAYSFYVEGDFEQAANLFVQFEGGDAIFSRANALAHLGQYFKAAELYQEVLTLAPNNTAASENLSLMTQIIKSLKKRPGKKVLSNEIAPNLKVNNTEKKVIEQAKVQSSKLWLEQVQQNPAKFLRKKFQQEHQNETK
ncbi:tetratricopeptide repeat protein [Colwellia psychrerythraea]|uniref:Tetratricopeptide TPR_2 repeat-containing protein n=1 Tax=Colwellia psychrerythraea TaxID=28229 RepID=A0A099KUE5_COLPS|nr:tetratricopeptide repeat protein [Colwellia psychrerythraea]KGJ94131.1 Tetratricopeptide TPR_2 repeat-containing protein [Colwellia psychrerythraea]